MKQTYLSLLIISLTACVSQDVYSVDKLGAGDAYYFEGTQKISLQQEPNLVAEFGNLYDPNQQMRSTVKSADKSATFVKSKGMVTLWKTNQTQFTVSAKNGSTIAVGVSPVFRSGSGSLMALPGNIFVEFQADITDAQADSLLGKKGLTKVRDLGLPNRKFWEVKTAPGLVALSAANGLVGTPGVLSASPNWWREASSK